MVAPILQIPADIDEEYVNFVAGPAVNSGEQGHTHGFEGAEEVLVAPKTEFLVSIQRYM